MRTTARWLISCFICSVGMLLPGYALAAEKAAQYFFCCRVDNDLHQVLGAGGAKPPRFDTPAAAVEAATSGAGVLILADGYPEKLTAVEPAVLEQAAKKHLRLYVEYPESLPDMMIGQPKEDRLLRGVVTSDIFGESLRPMRLVGINGCRYVPVEAGKPYLVLAKVAGVDAAVFGLKDTPADPLLFDHPRGHLLVATTKLSHFVTGRYMPEAAWRTIWQTILKRLQPDAAVPELAWTPTVRPSYGRDEALPADVEMQAFRRSTEWLTSRRMLRHADWPKEMLDWSLKYNTLKTMPGPDCPEGDGSLGILEGFSSTIRADGSQPMRYAVRNDCTNEVAMQLAFDAVVGKRPESGQIAGRMVDYIFGKSGLAGGKRADSANASFGLVGWELDIPDGYWGDDNARAMLGVLAVSALNKETRWNEAVARNILANFRTSGVYGCRVECLREHELLQSGWRSHYESRFIKYSPHMEAWLWPCFLWAYEKTGFEPFLTRSERGMRATMAMFPRWYWEVRSGTIQRARMLLPLAWLVRVKDTPEHRRWLRTMTEDLLTLQEPSGAIREIIGDGGPGTPSNASYGSCETSVIQADGDPVSDSLYSCNFALIGLHEAAEATGEAFYAEAEEKLAKYLCRIQVRSEKHPELDGAWYRAFNFRNWEYWACNSDSDWGPWCTETGWTQPWIAGTLALRQMKTSLWDVVKRADISKDFDALRRQMIPDDVLEADARGRVRHAAMGKMVALTTPADVRYPGFGPAGLVDGWKGSEQYNTPDWMGFHGSDFEATIDLGEATAVTRLTAGFLQSTAVGIYLPSGVEFSTSDDGKDFRVVATIKPDLAPQEAGPVRRAFIAEKLNARGRYVRVKAANVGTIPEGQPAAGAKAWLFVDEIVAD